MGGEFLIWLVLFGVIFWSIRRRRQQAPRDTSRLLGYRKIPPERFSLRAPLPSGEAAHEWEILQLEDIPHARRRRVLLSILFEPSEASPDATERLLWRLAVLLQRAVRAHVVVVEAFNLAARTSAPLAGQGHARLIFAVDGQGWSGEEQVFAALLNGHDPQPRLYSLADVQRRASQTLDAAFPGE